MKLNANAAHVIAVLLAAAGATLHFLQLNPEVASEARLTSNGLLTLGFVVALLSQSLLGTATPQLPGANGTGGGTVPPLVVAASKAAGAILVATAMMLGAAAYTQGCTAQQAKSVGQTLVPIAVDACQEAPQLVPAGQVGTVVGLICAAVDATAPGVEVIIDAKTWAGMKAAYLTTHPALPAGMAVPR